MMDFVYDSPAAMLEANVWGHFDAPSAAGHRAEVPRVSLTRASGL